MHVVSHFACMILISVKAPCFFGVRGGGSGGSGGGVLKTNRMSFYHLVCRDKVQALVYAPASRQLISTADDKIIGIWDMEAQRIEVSNTYLT